MNRLIKSIPAGLLITLASVFTPISAQSEETPVRGPIPFTAYDQNGNSLISEKEFNAVRGERMAARAAEGRPMRGAASAPDFSQFDTDSDGQLTPDELAIGQRTQMEKRRGMGMGMGMGMGQGRGMGQGMAGNMPAFSEFDLDGNGRIIEQELNDARSKRISERAQQGYQMRNLGRAPSFADIDTDGDGEVTPDEFAAHQKQHRTQGAQ